MSKKKPFKYELLKDLCDRANLARKKASCRAYLVGEEHAAFAMTDEWCEDIRRQTADLERGIVSPDLRISTSEELFKTVMSEFPGAAWVGCSPYDDDKNEEENESCAGEIIRRDFIDDLNDEDLFDFLVNEKACNAVNYGAPHDQDIQRIDTYQQCLRVYVERAAALAKGVGSSSMRQFLDVLRRLMPSETQGPKAPMEVMDAEEALSLYRALKDAHAALWVDLRAAALRPIKVVGKGRTSHKR